MPPCPTETDFIKKKNHIITNHLKVLKVGIEIFLVASLRCLNSLKYIPFLMANQDLNKMLKEQL